MGSASDKQHCEKIRDSCKKYGVECVLRVTSAHKGTEDTLKILKRIEGEAVHIPTCIVAVAGRSNGLGPVMSGNCCLPVINCPPVSSHWGTSDIWSSLRLPSGGFIAFLAFYFQPSSATFSFRTRLLYCSRPRYGWTCSLPSSCSA